MSLSYIETIDCTIELAVAFVNTTTSRALKLKGADIETVLDEVVKNFNETIHYSDMEQIKINYKSDSICNAVISYAKTVLPEKDEKIVEDCIKMCKLTTGAWIVAPVGDKNIQFKISKGSVVNKEESRMEYDEEDEEEETKIVEYAAEDELKEEEFEPEIIVPAPAPTPTKKEAATTPKAPKKSKEAAKPAKELAEPINLIEAIENVISAPPVAAKKGGRPKKSDEEKLAEKERKLAEKKDQKEAEKKRKLAEKMEARDIVRQDQKEAKKEERNAKRRELNAILKTMSAEEQAEYKAELKAESEKVKAEQKAQTEAKKAQLAAIKEAKAKIPVVPKKTKADILIEQMEVILENMKTVDYVAISEKNELIDRDVAVVDVFCSLVGITDKSWKNVRELMENDFAETYLRPDIYVYNMEQNIKDMQSRVRFYKKTNKLVFEESEDLAVLCKWTFTMFELINHEKKCRAQKLRAVEKQELVAQIKAEKLAAIEAEKKRKIDEKAAKKEESERKKNEREMKKSERESKKAELEAKRAAKLVEATPELEAETN